MDTITSTEQQQQQQVIPAEPVYVNPWQPLVSRLALYDGLAVELHRVGREWKALLYDHDCLIREAEFPIGVVSEKAARTIAVLCASTWLAEQAERLHRAQEVADDVSGDVPPGLVAIVVMRVEQRKQEQELAQEAV